MKNIGILAICLIAVGSVGIWYGGAGGIGPMPAAGPFGAGNPVFYEKLIPESARVMTEPARMARVFDAFEVVGTAQANESIVLTAPVDATIRRVLFDDGDFVEAGTVLVELTSEQDDALLTAARSNLVDAENREQRIQDLVNQGLSAESALEVARARSSASEARLDTVLARLEDRLVRAPFTGLLRDRRVSPGSNVTPTSAIATLNDISVITADVMVPENLLSIARSGAMIFARIASTGDREIAGVVDAVNARVDPETRSFAVRVRIENHDRVFQPGAVLAIRVVTQERQGLVVSENAVLRTGARSYVYLVGDDGIARQRDIEIQSRQFRVIEVGAGLMPGDRVVTEGFNRLRDGIPVQSPEVIVDGFSG
ncbi:MAG: efflux RND transporter periplasmic adaptor subunit [Gammaproteobacteria bacterium]